MRRLFGLVLFLIAVPLFAAPVAVQPPCPKAAVRPAITGIAFVAFYVSDDAAATKFYGGELGLHPVAGANGTTIYPVNRQQWVETLPSVAPVNNSRLAGVGLAVANVGQMRCYLLEKGYKVMPWVDSVTDGGTNFFDNSVATKDPEGNVIAFVPETPGSPADRSIPSANAVSHRIIHAGFVVQSADKENTFYRDVLGFKPYWHGGMHDGVTDFISQQVPNGTDWIEFMLNVKPDASAEQRGVSNHFSLGVRKMDTAIAQFKANGCDTHNCTTSQMGRDGKVQLNVFDPDHSRVELMEYEPSGTVCCSPFVGKMPSENDPQ